jgi:Golgi SNAP receptor complex protein 2
MASIVELFPKCRKLAYDARQQLALTQLQQPPGSSGGGQQSVSELYLVLEELNRQLDCMDELVLRETPAQRTVWKRKIAELRQESATLQQQQQGAPAWTVRSNNKNNNNGSNYYGGGGAGGASNYQAEREELMLRRRKRLNDEGEMQNLASESQSLEQSHSMVLDILQTGEASYQDLKEQRQRLRGVTRILADIGNSLGLSQATMRIIERRDITDAYFVAAGMVVTLVVIYFTWF